MNTSEALLKGILATVARSVFPPDVLLKLVAPTVGSDKNIIAFNLCDGETPQAEIAKQAKLDKGFLSKAITKWIESGIVVRVGPDQHPLHIYPLTKLVKSTKKGG